MRVHSKSNRNDLWVMRFFVSVFSIAGVGLLVGGIYAGWQTRRFLQIAVEVPGVVSENVWQQSTVPNNHGVYVTYAYPRIRFRTEDGREVSVLVSSTGTNPPLYRVNEPVTILYDPHAPQHASIQSFQAAWLLPMVLCGIGTVLCSFGIGAAVWWRVSTRKRA